VLVGLSAIVVAIGSLMHAGHDHGTTTTSSTDRPSPRPAVNRGL
jgi:hypothetical protein